jgi:alkylated DNA repair dioxygenase AlkB
VHSVPIAATQKDLFETASPLPEGMRYAPDMLSPAEEEALLEKIPALPFKEFAFHGFLGKRRVVSFGWRYDFDGGGLGKADAIPEFLLPVREHAARFAGLAPEALAHALVLEYTPGAAIGWHRDRPVFDDVIGISLLAPCSFRLRRKAGATWERRSLIAEPRSAYLLRGSARTDWEHSIPPLDTLRYSITFRSLAQGRGRKRAKPQTDPKTSAESRSRQGPGID